MSLVWLCGVSAPSGLCQGGYLKRGRRPLLCGTDVLGRVLPGTGVMSPGCVCLGWRWRWWAQWQRRLWALCRETICYGFALVSLHNEAPCVIMFVSVCEPRVLGTVYASESVVS